MNKYRSYEESGALLQETSKIILTSLYRPAKRGLVGGVVQFVRISFIHHSSDLILWKYDMQVVKMWKEIIAKEQRCFVLKLDK